MRWSDLSSVYYYCDDNDRIHATITWTNKYYLVEFENPWTTYADAKFLELSAAKRYVENVLTNRE